MLLTILKYIAAIATVGIGVYSLIWPKRIDGFTGVSALNQRGVTEIRTIFGAVFIGLGGAALLLFQPGAHLVVGITYLALAVVRTVSMVIDRSIDNSNIISGVTELLFGIIFIL